jgi:Mg-chelatase subunit ChlD
MVIRTIPRRRTPFAVSAVPVRGSGYHRRVDRMKRTTIACAGAALAVALCLSSALPAVAAGGLDCVIAIDCTGTMRFHGRAVATEAAVRGLVDALEPGDRVTVFGYGEGAYPLLKRYPVEIVDDGSTQDVVDGLRLAFDDDRTDITAGLELVWREREEVLPAAGSERSGCIVVLTDGKLIPVYDDYSKYDAIHAASEARLRELGRVFARAGVPVMSIALGKADQVDGALLAEVSKSSGGGYFHAADARALAGCFREVVARTAPIRAAAPAGGGASEPDGVAATPPTTESVVETPPGTARRHHGSSMGLIEGAAAAAGRPSAYPGTLYQGTTAALGIIMGIVAMGVHRRQSWTAVFTRSLGRTPARVRGYLKPVEPPGATLARPCVPLENPGHVCVRLGVGGDFMQEVTDTAMEFIGTREDAGPLLRVVSGSVVVDGEVVKKTRQISDGEVIAFEGRRYVYLRGSRR